ncbi:HlyD family secretion protein [Erwiniaceae bacterium CAU 1747]
MEKNNIFRREAIDYQRQQWTGKALLLSGLSARLIVILCAAFLAILIFCLIYFDYTRRIDVDGEITTLPHSITVFAPQQATVVHSYIKVGDRVKKGDRLYELDVSRQTISGSISGTAADAINQQMLNVKAIIDKLAKNRQSTVKTLQDQINQYQQAHKETLKMVASAKDATNKMRQMLEGYEQYIKRGLINKDQLNYQRQMYQQQQSVWQSLNSQSMQEDVQLAQLRSDLITRAADYDNQISQNESQLSDLNQRLAESNGNDMLVISAKMDGIVESLSVTNGQMVESGSSLAQIKPVGDVSYYLLLWLPDTALPFVKLNEGINIRYDAFPSDKFGQFPGKVVSVSSLPASPQEMSGYTSGSRKAQEQVGTYYKVLVSLEHTQFSDKGKKLAISSGLRARAIVFLDKKPLYRWAIAPIYDIKNSVTGSINEK